MTSIRVKKEPGISADEVTSSSVANNQLSAAPNSRWRQINQAALINIDTEELSKLTYPVDCPVWYNFRPGGSANELIFTRGMVVGAAMDRLTRSFVYRIEKDDKSMDFVLEDEITYAMGCTVRLSNRGMERDGEIVCSSREHVGNGIVPKYSVIVSNGSESKLIHGVNAQQLKYREATGAELKAIERAVPRVSIGSESETTSATSRHLKWKPPSLNKRKALADRDLNMTSEKIAKKTPELSLSLIVPRWVLQAGNDLVGALNADKFNIENKVKCPIQIRPQGDQLIVSIVSISENREERGHSIVSFKRIIQNALASHLNDDKCKGRLLFDLAKTASGSYKIAQTLSGAVKQQSIVDQDGLVWMRLVDIPLAISNSSRLDTGLSKISSRYAGTPIYLGLSALCNPYVLVYGYDLDKVDHASTEIMTLIDSYRKMAPA